MTGVQSKVVTRALEMIAKGMTVTEAARMCGCSRPGLSKAYKRSKGPPLPEGRRKKEPK